MTSYYLRMGINKAPRAGALFIQISIDNMNTHIYTKHELSISVDIWHSEY